jgi:hypothetical protein
MKQKKGCVDMNITNSKKFFARKKRKVAPGKK